MEGLIPFICKAIKRRKNRSFYRSLSSTGDVAAEELSTAPLPENHASEFEMAKFDGGGGSSDRQQLFMTPPPESLSSFVLDAAGEEVAVPPGWRLRRYASLQHELPGGLSSPPQKRVGAGGRGPAKFLRARSHRVLACVNGSA